MTGGDQARRAIRACQHAGLRVVNLGDCTCALRGRLVVLALPHGLRVVWPYEEPCPIHGVLDHAGSEPATEVRAGRMETGHGKRVMERSVPDLGRRLAAQLDAQFGQDAALARRLNTAQWRLRRANDRLWWGLHPDGLAGVYGEDPAAVDVAFAEHRSEVLGARDPLAAVQQVHWQIHRAFIAYQTVAEERRQLAADIGELIRQFVDALLDAGWSEEQARNTSVRELASNKRATQERN
jgi:hypothetical protein